MYSKSGSMGFHITLTGNGGVGFWIEKDGGTRYSHTVLRSNAGTGKEWLWQQLGLPKPLDGQWHKVVAQRVGSHASLELDGMVIALADNVPDVSPLSSSNVRIGSKFKGCIDDLQMSTFPAAVRTEYYDGFKQGTRPNFTTSKQDMT